MKARVKATGEIVELYIDSTDRYDFIDRKGNHYFEHDLEFGTLEPDYWTRLEHQYAGMVMQGILTNPVGFESLRARGTNIQIETALLASEFAHALVQKMKKKKEYPKTYEECCKVMDCAVHPYITANEPGIVSYYEDDLNREVLSFRKLKICRDAYWKLYGEEKGLEEPWKLSIGTPIYYIYYNRTVDTIKNDYADDIQGNVVLAFPTEEMRDAFYENFKELIESVKELL